MEQVPPIFEQLQRTVTTYWIYGLILSINFCFSSAYAADISLDLQVFSKDELVAVTVKSSGKDPVQDVSVKLELDGKIYEHALDSYLRPGSSKTHDFKITLPKIPGTYPLITTIYYLNDGVKLSLKNAAYFYYQEKASLDRLLSIDSVSMLEQGTLHVRYDRTGSLRVILPDEIKVEGQRDVSDGVLFYLRNQFHHLRLSYPIFAIIEDNSGPRHATTIVSARLDTKRSIKANSLFGPTFYALAALIGLGIAYGIYRRGLRQKKRSTLAWQELSPRQIAICRWAFSVFLVSALFFLFRTLYTVPDFFFSHMEKGLFLGTSFERGFWVVLSTFAEWLYFSGGDYDYFSEYVADPLYIYILLLNFFVLYRFVKAKPETDKYCHLMQTIFSIPSLIQLKGSKKIHWTSLSRLAILALMVKALYIPFMTSWTINNFIHQYNISVNFRWNFFYVNEYLVATLILVDVLVFAVGYLIEFPKLANEIKSVEPTILGWLVCIACYPPLNQFSFMPFEYQLVTNWQSPFGDGGVMIAKVLITLLWTIYVWATIALGWKASNLTNRGIVTKGPYRYMRHPAYASKLGLWIVGSIFLGDQALLKIAALCAVYGLRAWTEERHLGKDPEYMEYRKKVRWALLPGVG